MRNLSRQQKGIIALVGYALFASTIGIFIREMDNYFSNFQQVYMRAFVGMVIAFFLYRKRLSFENISKISKFDLLIMATRVVSLYLFGVVLFTKSITIASYANVTFIFALPYSAILGFIILREKITLKKITLVGLSLLGVLLVSAKDIFNFSSWGYGEILAIISAFFYALSSVLRKKLSNDLNSFESAFMMLAGGFLLIFISSNVAGDDISQIFSGSLTAYIAVFLAGLSNALISLCIDYGFKNIEAVKAGNIIYVESIFALFISVFLYNQIPNLQEIFGALLILMSAILINSQRNTKI